MPKFSTDKSRDDLRTQHSHRAPSEAAQATLRDIRQRFLDLAVAIDDLDPSTVVPYHRGNERKRLSVVGMDQLTA